MPNESLFDIPNLPKKKRGRPKMAFLTGGKHDEQLPPPRRKPGRPKRDGTTPVELFKKQEWVNKLYKLAKQGAGMAEIAGEMNMTRDNLYKLMDSHEYIRDIIDNCKQFSLMWWERAGRVNIENRSFNAYLYSLNMVNRHGWTSSKNKSDTTAEIKTKEQPLPNSEGLIDSLINTLLESEQNARTAAEPNIGTEPNTQTPA